MRIIKPNIAILLTLTIAMGLANSSCNELTETTGVISTPSVEGQEVRTVGPVGESGTHLYAGKGAPIKTLGEIEDFYLNMLTGTLYGPKTNRRWGNPIILGKMRNFQRPPRPPERPNETIQRIDQNGTGTSQIYANNKAPVSSFGERGDYYLNTTTSNLYGPKAENDWGSPFNLQKLTGSQDPKIPEDPSREEVLPIHLPVHQEK